MPRIVIVGGGITGLAAAFELESRTDVEVLLLESSSDVGGKIQTERIGDFLVEAGPDSIFTRKPWAVDLIREIGADHELILPQQRGFSMLIDGCLHPVPIGLVGLTAANVESVSQTDFLSQEAKGEVLREPTAPKGAGTDEAIGSFFRRRFGVEFARLVAEPLLAGTHGGDPEKLSMAAYYPAYLDKERRVGSLTGGSAAPAKPNARTFVSMKSGMATLVSDLLTHLVRTEIRTNASVEEVRPGLIRTSEGEVVEADQTIVAVPAYMAADLLGLESLRRIRHASCATVCLAYSKEALAPLKGTGFLVPQTETSEISGATFSSSKWGGRAPEDSELIRVFLGRDGGLNVDEHSDEELFEIAQRSIKDLLSISGKPLFVKLQRWTRGLPQYDVGHLDLLALIEEELKSLPGIHLAGASYRGVGIPDCIRQGREAAKAALWMLDGESK